MKLHTIAFLAVAAALTLPGSARADVKGVFKEAWTCAKSLPESAYTIAADVASKAEALSAMSASMGVCMAGTGGQPQMLAFVTTVLTTIKASKPDLLPSGQCKSRIHAQLAKPFGLGLAAILPASSAKTQLLKLAESEQSASWIWDTISSAPPPFSTIPSQVDCGCDMIDGAVTLADVSAVTNAISNTSKSCAGILDEAGLGFINKWGSSAISWVKGKYGALVGKIDDWKGEKQAAPDAIVYQAFYGVYIPDMAEEIGRRAPGTTAYQININNATGGWANMATYQSGYVMQIGALEKECTFYYDTHKMSSSNAAARCAQWREQAAAQAKIDGDRLRLQGNAMTVFRLKLYGWAENEWKWRLPPANPLVANNVPDNSNGQPVEAIINLPPMGKFKENKDFPWKYEASGIYAQARDALVQANYDQDNAYKAVMAGAFPAVRDAVLSTWNDSKDAVRLKWLPQWMPSQTFGGPYGCPSGSKIASACVKQVEAGFDAGCHPMIRDAYVLAPNVLGVAFKFGEAKKTCTNLLRSIADTAVELSQAGLSEVQSKAQSACPPPTVDRQKSASCVSNLQTAWQDCAAPQVGALFSPHLTNAKKCFQQKTGTLLYIPMQQPPQGTLYLPPQTVQPQPRTEPLPPRPANRRPLPRRPQPN